MAMEAADASKKHRRRASSDGAEEPSKRHKHHSSNSASRRDRDKDTDKDKDKEKHHHHRHHKHKHRHHRKHRAETPTDGHGSVRVSVDRHNPNGVPMETEEECRIRVAWVARVSSTIGEGEEKEEGEIVEGEEYFETMKTAESDIESGEIHSEEGASLKDGLDEVSSPKDARCVFKMPADKVGFSTCWCLHRLSSTWESQEWHVMSQEIDPTPAKKWEFSDRKKNKLSNISGDR